MDTTYSYDTEGTCSRRVRFNLSEGRVSGLSFEGGCDGNLKGLVALVEGMEAAEAARRLRGIPCGDNATSCPDQLARALAAALEASAAAGKDGNQPRAGVPA